MVTVITKTIGSGKDYASFTLAEADVPNIVGSRDLVGQDKAVVFEADAGTYNESVTFDGTLATDATRNVTYGPAAGSEHGGVFGAGVFIDYSSGSRSVYLLDDHTKVVGLSIRHTSTAATMSGDGVQVSACMVEGAGPTLYLIDGGSASFRMRAENCSIRATSAQAIHARDGALNTYISLMNCTMSGGGTNAIFMQQFVGTTNADITNCINLDCIRTYQVTGTGVTVTGSNNFGGSTNPFPASIQGSPYPITPSQSADPGAGDYALYVGKNGALLDSPNNDVIGQGVGPAANSDVPLFDILGDFRAGDTANPGAFEIPQATYTWKKTIGPVGRDYATFTLAEADVTNIPTSTDLVNENEAIVFEADAATYAENILFNSTLTADATRNVTYRPAVGSEHGGDKSSGVRIVSGTTVLTVQDEHTTFDGLVAITTGGAYLSVQEADGVIFRNLLMQGNGTCVLSWQNGATTPMLVENCVGYSDAQNVFYAFASTGEAHVKYRNCTSLAGGTARGWTAFGSATYHLYVDILNCIAIGTTPSNSTYGGNTYVTLTGSNNFGTSGSPFPVSIQGSPYPVTATTDTNPGPGDWAIYDAATGALINDSDNDVLAGGVGPSANSDVPETDIVGNLRSGSTADPGAFEISSIPAPLPGLSSDMQQIYQAEAAYTLALTPSGVTNVTHQTLGADDYLRVNNSTRSREVKFPVGVQAVRVVALADQKPCSVTVVLDDGAGGETESDIGYVGGGVIQSDSPYLWNLSALQSDGTYPKLKFTREGEWIGNQDIYVWWHTS